MLIPAGCVLLVFPLATYRKGTVNKDFVFLEVTTVSTAQASSAAPHAREYPVFTEDDLKSYPALWEQAGEWAKYLSLAPSRVERIARTRLDQVPVEEWLEFKQDLLGNGDEDSFQYLNCIFKGEVAVSYQDVFVEVPHLRTACKVTGALFMILSLFALRGIYATRSTDGIQVGKRSAMIIWDAVVILVGMTFTWWFVEFVLAKGFQTATEWGEDLAVGMGVFWMVFVYPVVALIVTATSLQTLWVSGEEIVLRGIFGRAAVAWPEVKSISVSQLHSARRSGGFLAPHRVMKVLEIAGRSVTLHVMEPPFASTKKEIISALLEHAPEVHKPRIAVASKEWLSMFT